MLSAIGEKARKTQIMYRANLNHGLLTKYLTELSDLCLARFERDESCYILTAKGKEFLVQYKDYLKRNKCMERRISDVKDRRKALEDLCSGNPSY
jgi:predicted transcriptional regulator